ncbi:hypothetical protein C0J52_07630 [Blattella germanica]|nr:hypothetical protein C0J52_07630 [Blattella germanica]
MDFLKASKNNLDELQEEALNKLNKDMKLQYTSEQSLSSGSNETLDMTKKLPSTFDERSGNPLISNSQSNDFQCKKFENMVSEITNGFQRMTLSPVNITTNIPQLSSDNKEQNTILRVGKIIEDTKCLRRPRVLETKKMSLTSMNTSCSDNMDARNPSMGLMQEGIDHSQRTAVGDVNTLLYAPFFTDVARIEVSKAVTEKSRNDVTQIPKMSLTDQIVAVKRTFSSNSFIGSVTERINYFQRATVREFHTSIRQLTNEGRIEQSMNVAEKDHVEENKNSKRPRRSRKKKKEKQTSASVDSNIPPEVLSSDKIVENNEIMDVTPRDLKNPDYNLEQSYHKVQERHGKSVQTLWKCTYKVKWPSENSFTATMSTKTLAGKSAALKALHWLQSQGKMTKIGTPVVFDYSEIKEMAKVPPEIIISPNKLQDGELSDIFGTDEPSNPVTGAKLYEEDSKLISLRNKELYNRYKKRAGSIPSKDEIVKKIEDHQVLVIKGEPGCGKSTQVPQYIMEHFESQQKGAHCNVLITQPRRISAISISEWIASERNERLGDVVGYQVRLKNVLPKPIGGGLLFCSTGILLRRLQNNPKLLGASHVILDEAHERDINTDMLLVLLRRALSLNPDLRLIVMSATINAELFQNYFHRAPAIHIPGFTYPVQSMFLEEIDIRKVHTSLLLCPNVDCNLVANTIKWVDKTRPEGAILCFLPGWGEISAVSNLLKNLNENTHLVLPVHSRLSHVEQRRIFTRPPPGVRKIILATNIAETSITIDDRGISSLDNQWVSQANVNQRKGRAGRVQPGECFHLYTRQKFNSMDPYPIPELLRAEVLLSEMPEPPPRTAVGQAVDELIHIGALDENEKLTPLGRRIALFPLHPKLSKALVHASIFKCLSPMLTIATMLTGDAEMFIGGLSNKEKIRSTKKRFHPSSDHVSLAWVYQEWEAMLQDNNVFPSDYCYERNLNNESLNTIKKLRRLYAEHLWMSRLLEDLQDYGDLDTSINRYAGNDEFVKGVLFSGTSNLLYRRNWDFKDGRYIKDVNVVFTESGRRTTISSDSVNFKRQEFPSPFLTYFRHLESLERRTVMIRESSILSPLSVFLFSEGTMTVHKYSPPPYCDENQWEEHVLIKIRRRKLVLWNMVNYFVLKSGIEDDDERYNTINSFHNRLLKTMGSVLFHSGSLIEYDKDGKKIE